MKVCECKGHFMEIIINNNRYFKCLNCGYLLKDDIKSAKEQKERYDFHVIDEGYLKYMRNISLELSKHLQEGLCLDFGCGKAHALADILKEKGIECEYYDLFYFPEFPEKMYDNIIMIEVFEHLENPFNELLKLKKYLNKNGKIIIKTQPYTNLDNWWYLRDITHISFITLNTLKIWAELLGMNFYCEKDIFVLTCI